MSILRTIVLSVLAVEIVHGNTIKGPPSADLKEDQTVVKLGDDIKIVCPIVAYPNPIITWTKDGEAINGYSWVRFRQNKKSLKIKGVMKEDAGTYFCKGTNGFGSDEVKVHLIVIDPADFPNLAEGEIPDVSLPSFSETTLALPTLYRRKTNDRIRIPCEANGKPTPDVQWLRYSPDFQSPQILDQNSRRVYLSINHLKRGDEGIYGCVARNSFGEVARNISLEVEGLFQKEIPVLTSGSEYANVEQGKRATLECKATGSSSFSLRWLKEYTGSEVPADIIDLGIQKFQVIQNDSKSFASENEGERINTLVIPDAQRSDAGMYVCVMESAHGFDFKNVSVSVTEGRTISDSAEIEPLLIVVICVSVVAFLILIAILIRVFRNKQKKPLISETPDVQENLMRKQQQQQLQQQQQQMQIQQQTQAQPAIHLPQHQGAPRATPNQYQIQQQHQQYQANLNNNRNMNIHINKLDQPFPPPPPPPSLHNEGSSSSNNPQWAIYPPTNSFLNYTDSTASTKYNGSSIYGGGPHQNEYEVPHVNSVMGMRSKNQAVGAPVSLHSGYGNNQQGAQQPIYPYRSQQYGFYDD